MAGSDSAAMVLAALTPRLGHALEVRLPARILRRTLVPRPGSTRMTTPPPEPPPGGWPPYGPYYGPDPYRQPRKESSTGLVVGLAVVGAFAYFAVNFVVALLVLMLAADSTSAAVLATGAVGLALFA